MYYSLTFAKGEKNTWADWGLIATSPPMIQAPQPNSNMVNIPGRRQGPIDLSKIPFGVLTYPRISGNWEFIAIEDDNRTRFDLYEEIRKWLHGRTTEVQTEDDPFHYFKGVFILGDPENGENTIGIKIGYNLEPVRYNMDDTEDTSFLIR